jgi:ATP-dependent Clp protease ATP-binding subunit ClpA
MVCKFDQLQPLSIKKIVVKFVDQLRSSLRERNIRINLSEGAIDLLVEQGYDAKMGARPLSRKIDELIKIPLSRKILFDRLRDCEVAVDVKDGKIIIDTATTPAVDESELPIVDANGYITITRFRPTTTD